MSAQQSDGGLTLLNPFVSKTLKASDGETNTAAAAETEVAGFGALKEIIFELEITSVSITSGTVNLTVWVQRKTPSGQWDDMLALKALAMSNANAAVRHVAEFNSALGSAATPAAIQDAGGTAPFAQRSTWLSDELRVKHQLSAASTVTWTLKAKGRP